MAKVPSGNVNQSVAPLLNLLEQRFGLTVTGSKEHLRSVQEHYEQKRNILLATLGEAVAISRDDYAKAFLISESARLLILREIMPRPKKKKK